MDYLIYIRLCLTFALYSLYSKEHVQIIFHLMWNYYFYKKYITHDHVRIGTDLCTARLP
jgi:hypothetical protein